MCVIKIHTVSYQGARRHGKIRSARTIPAHATRARGRADVSRDRENHRGKAAAQGAAPSRLVEQQPLEQCDDKSLAESRLRERAGEYGSAQAGVSACGRD